MDATASTAGITQMMTSNFQHAMWTATMVPSFAPIAPGKAPEIRQHRDEIGNALGHTAVYTPDVPVKPIQKEIPMAIIRNFDTAEVAFEMADA